VNQILVQHVTQKHLPLVLLVLLDSSSIPIRQQYLPIFLLLPVFLRYVITKPATMELILLPLNLADLLMLVKTARTAQLDLLLLMQLLPMYHASLQIIQIRLVVMEPILLLLNLVELLTLLRTARTALWDLSLSMHLQSI
jgi:hypothetical protein